jgi:hypothetical protein
MEEMKELVGLNYILDKIFKGIASSVQSLSLGTWKVETVRSEWRRPGGHVSWIAGVRV